MGIKISFPNSRAISEYFDTPDDYALSLNHKNLEYICGPNSTANDYWKLFKGSLRPIYKTDREKFEHFIEMVNEKIDIDLEVLVIATTGCHSLDLPQTRKEVILLPKGHCSYELFVHELYHVISRKYPIITETLAQEVFGFNLIEKQDIKHSRFLVNPDAIDIKYSIRIDNIELIPIMTFGIGTKLINLSHEEVDQTYVNKYLKMIKNTSYLAHPEEICAEYFALVVSGSCLCKSRYKSKIKAEHFKSKLLKLLGTIKNYQL